MKLVRSHVLVGIDADSLLAGARQVEQDLIEAVADAGLTDEVQVLETGSLGLVGQGVVIAVYPDRIMYAGVTSNDVADIVQEHLLKGRVVQRLAVSLPTVKPIRLGGIGLTHEQPRVVLQNCGRIDPESLNEAIAAGAYQGIAKVIEESLSPQDVVQIVSDSGLRGRGGAGFPTGKKWSFTASGPEKYVVCNADEGEPGTFKDRLILEGDPHRLIEGMILAGYAIGAHHGIVYIRGEYALSIERMQNAIHQAYDQGLLGEHILDSDISFSISITKGAGAYVCGEETALIESSEGKRGFPRLKPPFPGAVGLHGKPTVVNNVETLANVAPIVAHGAKWFHTLGTKTCPGTKVYTILGHVATPGLIETEMGTTLREIIYKYGGGMRGGKRFKAALIGGAAGAFVAEDGLDIPMDFDSLREYAAVLGSGAILVLEEGTSIVELLRGILHFFRHESCGQCAPCRVGTQRLVEFIDRISLGRGTSDDLDLLVDVAAIMRDTSFCPLGQSPILPIESALRDFGTEFRARIRTTTEQTA
ncbi:NADH-quinone oxidoreductase subunit NuoF [Candidatus Bipolaricaulota bacterium]|nr:NADH-quinone oxidoreductase subunit NuoF [Candidatus Bipolaricaulota bacterium]